MNFDKEIFDKAKKKYMEKYKVSDEEAERRLLSLGPKRLFTVKVLSGDGWRAGYTKPTIEAKKLKNRKKEKARRKANRQRRK